MPLPYRAEACRSRYCGTTGSNTEPPTPSPTVMCELALPTFVVVNGQTPLAGTTAGLQVNTLSVKKRTRPMASKWPQPGSNAAFPMMSGAVSVLKLLAKAPLPRKLLPALAQLTINPFTEPPFAMAPVAEYTCSAGFSNDRPRATVEPKSFTIRICQLRV